MLGKIQKFFDLINGDRIEQLAKESKFVRRSSAKLVGKTFLGLILQVCFGAISASLNTMCCTLYKHYGLSITARGLCKRFNKYSTAFVYDVLSDLMCSTTNDSSTITPLLDWCTGIYLSDCTGFNLPDCFKEEFPGSGGGNKAQAKLYYCYDLLRQKAIDYLLVKGTTNDSLLMKSKDFVAGVLYLFDLGFFKKERLTNIAKAGAFVLTRQKRGVKMWLADRELHQKVLEKQVAGFKQGQGIRLIELLKTISVTVGATKVIPIYLYNYKTKQQILYYLHITKLPESARESKLKQRAEKYRKKGKPDAAKQQQDKFMCSYNTFITNANEEQIPAAEAQKIYALRWQIELVFKSWKTHFRIDEINKCSPERLKTMIGAFLIATWIVNVMAHQADKVIKQKATQKKNKKGRALAPPAISYFKICGLIPLEWVRFMLRCFKNDAKEVRNIQHIIIRDFVLYGEKEYKKPKKAA